MFVRGVTPPLVEVDSVAGLGSLMHLDDFLPDDGPRIAPRIGPGALGRRRMGNVVMVGSSQHPEDASVWVAAGYGDYRSAYRAFLKAAYGLSVSTADLAPYDVDHLLNRARAGAGTALLRVEALPLSNNRQWGSFLERMASVAQVRGNNRTRRLMSYLIAGKVAGFAPPTSLDDLPSRQRLALQIAGLGLPLAEVQDGLDAMLTHIARNLS